MLFKSIYELLYSPSLGLRVVLYFKHFLTSKYNINSYQTSQQNIIDFYLLLKEGLFVI